MNTPKQSSLATTALILSILALLSMCFIVGLIFAVGAIVTGHISYSKIRSSGGNLKGSEIALTSMIIGYFSAFISILILMIILAIELPILKELQPPAEIKEQVTRLDNDTPDQRYEAVIKCLSSGQQNVVEQLLDVLIRKHPSEYRLIFTRAVCARSRWSKLQAGSGFGRVLELAPSTPEGNCARYILELDKRKYITRNMDALRLLIKNNPDNPLFLWLMAIECRDYFKYTYEPIYSQEGEKCYRRLLEIFDVGPVMVHHTFANMLTEELNNANEALKHRRIAVKMEPSSWTYQGLGNTLSELSQYDEANRAFTKMIDLSPNDVEYLESWAISLENQKRYEECIEKSRKIIELAPDSVKAYTRWGRCLANQGKHQEALEIFRKVIMLDPANSYAYWESADALTKMGRNDEAQPYYKQYAELCERKVVTGNSIDQFNLAQCYNYGFGVTTNMGKAIELYQKAAAQGNAGAQFSLGWRYFDGNGVPKDPAKAAEWWRKAADQGHAQARDNLVNYFGQNVGNLKDTGR
jgi:tetratricopeptide (TPR) repeat protein